MSIDNIYRLTDGVTNEETLVYTKQGGEEWRLHHRIPDVFISSILKELQDENIPFKCVEEDTIEIIDEVNLLKIKMLFKQEIINRLEGKIQLLTCRNEILSLNLERYSI